ncbi:MAG: hypothetical protein JWO62_3437 [Acidimicrobiaceae bacterium]|jgi:hypothetical protein|nr:hypothetical protein [Acidimicrobiaceae bacterium]
METSDPRDDLERVPASARDLDDGSAAQGVEGNARLTGTTAAVLLLLLAAEGVTILSIRSLLTVHVFIGMLLIPPVALKIGSTTYRFFRYYTGAPAYHRKGPPPVLLRLLGPLLVVLTVVVLASGVALMFVGTQARGTILLLHKVSFVLWFGAMAVHVLGHLVDTTRLAPADFYHRTRSQVHGAGLRQWSLAATLVVGALLGSLLLSKVGPYLAR